MLKTFNPCLSFPCRHTQNITTMFHEIAMISSISTELQNLQLEKHNSNCAVAFRPAVLAAARAGSWIISFGLRGPPPPGFYSLRGGWVNRPPPEAPLIRGMPTGPLAFLGNAGRVWATALRPDPPKKSLVPHLPVRWGAQQIQQHSRNTFNVYAANFSSYL